MLISKLIAELQTALETHGDVHVMRARDGEWNSVHKIYDVSGLMYVPKNTSLNYAEAIDGEELADYDVVAADCHKVLVLT